MDCFAMLAMTRRCCRTKASKMLSSGLISPLSSSGLTGRSKRVDCPIKSDNDSIGASDNDKEVSGRSEKGDCPIKSDNDRKRD